MSSIENCTSQESEFQFFLKIILSIFCVILLRIFIENFLNTSVNGKIFPWQGIAHATLYFFSVFFAFAISVYFFTKDSFKKIFAYLVKVFTFILVVPFVDYFVYGKVDLRYLMVKSDEILPTYFTLMNPLSKGIVTSGQYIAVLGIFAYLAHYVYKKTKNYLNSCLAIFFCYTFLFLCATIPSFLISFSLNQTNDPTGIYGKILSESWYLNMSQSTVFFEKAVFINTIAHELSMARIYFLIILVQLFIFLYNSNFWKKIKTNLRLSRIFYWTVISITGMIMAQKIFGDINLSNSINVISIVFYFCVLVLNIWLAVSVNDLEDMSLDKISNKTRPLAGGAITVNDWQKIQFILIVLLIIGLMLLNISTALPLILVQLLYYIYSTGPYKLKRHFLTASLTSGLGAIMVSMSGFFFVSPSQNLNDLPIKAFAAIGIIFALLSNFKDLKDYEGDLACKIKTIPVIFGFKKAKYIIVSFWIAVLFWIALFFEDKVITIFSIATSLIVFYLFTKKKYQEKYIILVFLLYTAVLFFEKGF